jgi:hypothetical protein
LPFGLVLIAVRPTELPPHCGISATVNKCFRPDTLRGEFSALMSQHYNGGGGGCMGIEAVLLIVILTFGAAYLVDRLITGRYRPRQRRRAEWRHGGGIGNRVRKRPG